MPRRTFTPNTESRTTRSERGSSHNLLCDEPRSERVVLDSVFGVNVRRGITYQECAALERSARPDRSHDHEIELEDASHDRAEVLEDVADVEAGGHDTRHL